MNAVNLIPPDQRRGGGAGGGWGTYALLAGLALVLVAVAAYVVTSSQISARKDDLATARQKAAVATAQVNTLAPYVKFATLEETRLRTVHDLAASRFDWERTMGDLGRVTTSDVWLVKMLGTVAPGIEVGDAGSGSGEDSDLREAELVPAVELTGCGSDNDAVVGYLSRLRALTGVTRVTLADAQKPEEENGTSAPATPSGKSGAEESCGPDPHVPKFHAIVFFRAPAGAVAAAGGTG